MSLTSFTVEDIVKRDDMISMLRTQADKLYAEINILENKLLDERAVTLSRLCRIAKNYCDHDCGDLKCCVNEVDGLNHVIMVIENKLGSLRRLDLL